MTGAVKSSIWLKVARWAGGTHRETERRQLVSCVLYDNESGPRWPAGQSWNTKIILNKSGTVGACLVLRQRGCVTAPLFTRTPNYISLTPDRNTVFIRWPKRKRKIKQGRGCLAGFVFTPFYHFIEVTFCKFWQFSCSTCHLLKGQLQDFTT